MNMVQTSVAGVVADIGVAVWMPFLCCVTYSVMAHETASSDVPERLKDALQRQTIGCCPSAGE